MHLLETEITLHGARILTNDRHVAEIIAGSPMGRSPIAKQIRAAIADLERTQLRVETLLIVFKSETGTVYIRALPSQEFLDLRILDAPGTVSMSMEELDDARASATY